MPLATIAGRALHYTLHAAEHNAPNTLSIVFVHGLGSSENFYGPVLPYLKRYNRIMFDNYGAGRSKLMPNRYPSTSIPDIARDVVGLMDYLEIPKAVVVGFSMGGMVPTTIAASAQMSYRMLSGICVGPVHPGGAEVKETFNDRIKAVSEHGMEAMGNVTPYAAVGPDATALQKSFIREMIMAQEVDGYVANCRAIVEAPVPDYAAVKVPMLIIAGEVDKSCPVSGCQFIHDSMENVKDKKIEVLSRLGHWMCVEDPDQTGKLMAEWCAKIESSV